MGTIYSCDFCGKKETEDNHILEIHSHGRRDGQLICFACLKRKIEVLRLYQERLRQIPDDMSSK